MIVFALVYLVVFGWSRRPGDDLASLKLHCAVHRLLFTKLRAMLCAKTHASDIQVADDDEWTT